METKNIGKIFSCSDCAGKLKPLLRKQLGCPILKMKNPTFESGIIHSDCPFEDYNLCGCQPFQSFPKKKTEWKPVKEIKETEELYWLLDKDNNIAEGFLRSDRTAISIFETKNEKFGIPVMFAEIKPPDLPK